MIDCWYDWRNAESMDFKLASVPTASTDQKFCRSGDLSSSMVITEVICSRANDVSSEIVLGSGPDSKYPSLDC